MSEIRLYVDEGSQSEALLAFLRANGMDVLSPTEAGTDGTRDEEQLAFARREQRALLTANIRDFRRLHGEVVEYEGGHFGLLYWTRDLSVGELGRRILRLHASLSAAQVIDREEFLSAWGEQQN